MDELSMIPRALLLCVLALTGLGISPHIVHSQSRVSADDRTLREAAHSLQRQGIGQVERWLQQQASVASAMLGTDGQTLDIRFRDGEHAALLSSTLKPIRVNTRSLYPNTRTFSQPAAPGARALLLEPFATQLGLGPGAADAEANFLHTAGFAVDELSDAQVSVSAVRSMPLYNVVYMQTHSGVNAGGEGVLATGQAVNDDPSVAPLIQNGSVLKVGISGSAQLYYGITSTFVRSYFSQFPGNALVFLNGCNLLDAPVFWQALQSRGVGALVSWHDEATSKDNVLSGAAFFAEMAQGKTVADALTAELAAGYGKSTVNGKDTTMGFLGDGTITLANASNPPAATPIPTSVPIKPTATARPAPTSTPTPLPSTPLTVSLRHRVAPGTQQTVQIISSPETVVHVRVSFSTGDGRIVTTATDSTGHAKVSFLQHSSRVTVGHVFGMVTVDAATPGRAMTTVTELYRILWAPIDVAVEPRTQAVGGHITFWVHSRAHMSVDVAIHFPSGTVLHLQAVTAANGWAHVPYTIGHYLKKPNNHVARVFASAEIGDKVVGSRTTFTIT
jgi:hypothetical protein